MCPPEPLLLSEFFLKGGYLPWKEHSVHSPSTPTPRVQHSHDSRGPVHTDLIYSFQILALELPPACQVLSEGEHSSVCSFFLSPSISFALSVSVSLLVQRLFLSHQPFAEGELGPPRPTPVMSSGFHHSELKDITIHAGCGMV